jgi:hypothetical protein
VTTLPTPTTTHKPLQGLDWVLLRLLPVLGFAGVLVPLAGVWVTHALVTPGTDQARLDMLDFWWMGATVVYWSLFMTVLVGCSIAWAFRRGKSMLFSRPPADPQ